MGVTILRGRFGGSKFQFGQTRSECPKIMKISKSSLYTFRCPKVALNPMQTSKKCFAHGVWVFRPLFDSCSGHFDAKNTYFYYGWGILLCYYSWGILLCYYSSGIPLCYYSWAIFL